MNEVKQKIREMINEETATKRREELVERREKKSKNKSSNKENSERIPMDVEKKKLIRSLSFIATLVVCALGLFYGASISKQSAQNDYHHELSVIAESTLAPLMKQANQILNKKIIYFEKILKEPEYIKNFDTPSWQGVLKTELEAQLGDKAVVEFIPADFNNDEIIDAPSMGYGVLSILTEFKSNTDKKPANSIKVEVHKANSKVAKLVFIQKVTLLDKELKKERILGYIMARLPQAFVKELIKDFKPNTGYIEIVQLFSGKSSVLAKSGNSSLKSMPLVISKKLSNTQWTFKLWPAEQPTEVPASLLWLSFVYLGLGSFAIVSALLLLVLVFKNIQAKRYIALPERRVSKDSVLGASQKASDSTARVTEKTESADSIYNKDSGISLQEEEIPVDEHLKKITDKIFRAYDIRGVVGDFINADIFSQIAYGIAKEMSEKQQTKVAVACDGRNSSPELVKAVIDALLKSGIHVLDVGMVTSPILYFSAITKADGNGLMITASHNPAEYNGMKIMLMGHSYSDVRLQKLKAKVQRGEQVSGKGKLLEMDIMEEYLAKITGNVILARPMKIVIDSGNAVIGKFAASFFEQLGCKVTALNCEVDGNFPVHDPDPSRPENMSELIEKVAEVKADLGIAFDGDGDRIGLVSSGGEIIWPDRILMLLAKDILSRNKDATILYDVKSSWKLKSFIDGLGGKAIMCKSGHSFMKTKLLETGALLAGEMSGHIFIKERWFGFDDALFVAARVLEILSIDLRKSRQVFAELPDSLNTPEILIATTEGPAIMEKMSADTSCFSDGEIITIDGIRVEFSDGWGLVRASNTSDNLTMRFEADNEEALQRIANVFKEALVAAEPQLEFPF